MSQHDRCLIHRFRSLIVGGILGLFLIGTIGGVALLHSGTAKPQGKVIANQGYSLLYISADMNGKEILSMLRTSDGHQLWQYHLPGELEMISSAITAAQAVQIFNGIVYFVVALPSHLNPTSFRLIALYANNGQPLWQTTIHVFSLNFIGVVAGVVCLQTTSLINQGRDSIASIYGYQADTGLLSWKRTILDIGGVTTSFWPLVVDNMLCFISRMISTTQRRIVGSGIIAVQPENGQTLWRFQSTDAQLLPLSGENGILVVYGSTGNIYQPESIKTHLFGVHENNGSLAWQRQQIGTLAVDISQGSDYIDIPARNNVICLVTSPFAAVVGTETITLTAIHVSDGTILWQQNVHLNQSEFITGFDWISNSLYLELMASSSNGIHPQFVASSLTAWDVRTGKKRWQRDGTPPDSAGRSTSLRGDSNTPLFWLADQTLYVLRPRDGSVLQHYSLPPGSPYTLTVAEGKAIFTYSSPQTNDLLPPDNHSLSFSPNQTTPLWDYHLQMYIYAIEVGP